MIAPEDISRLRRRWHQYQYAHEIPRATVLATADWLAYVEAMASMLPEGDYVTPTEEQCRWAWPDGVLLVLAEPVELEHVITGGVNADAGLPSHTRSEPHHEQQMVRAVAIGKRRAVPALFPSSGMIDACPVLWLGVDFDDVIIGRYQFGFHGLPDPGRLGASSQFLLAAVIALGHRLTVATEPVAAGRAARRRLARELDELPDLRVIRLSTNASKPEARTGTVEWSRRWMVRGHWRLQPFGPRRSLRRLQWIDAFIKGPDDKPLDVRPTVWTTEAL